MPFSSLLSPGHTACAGCGMILAMRHALDILGRDTIICGATGCSEVTTTKYPTSAFNLPYIHSLFENPSSVASGVLAMLNRKNLADKVNVLVHGGDGFFFDIGVALNSGAWHRGDNVLYLCYDNEAYMNTGIQASSSTQLDTYTMTSPAGKKSSGYQRLKKDMPAIALAHRLPYVATATIGNLADFDAKIKKATSINGPKYIQVYSTCVPGWNCAECNTIKIPQLAQQSGLYPVVEYIDGKLASVMKVPKDTPKVSEFLKLQGRYRHLFKDAKGRSQIRKLQELANDNIIKYKLK
ncbi:pyruvate ferredoxin oxidoreductase [Candidatus Falkowbacteria bacterium RIFOXYC2_FULL_36_12]|uniref:Pyruvate ferredoxin oxidoreductase n=1 Tax=Candidatus Falkowbacteria bacterium RIFOXYC2_FULL_36_12 TaxID=1798002 RepID=A0A1F5T4B4_9BACT|nr:MAG: pyruvate ferredoxin oxidoreductase [Candidatus Falkowbacteria bacterium RIFOXYC2_FULL_36_12]